jgi:chromosome segregation ATPase
MFTKKATRERLKKLKKEIKSLKTQYKKMEFRPCQNDAELREKEEDLRNLMERIYSLENEQDRFILNASRISNEK